MLALMFLPSVTMADNLECTDNSQSLVLGSFVSIVNAEAFMLKSKKSHPLLTNHLQIASERQPENQSNTLIHRVLVSAATSLGPTICLKQLHSLGFTDAWTIANEHPNNQSNLSTICAVGNCEANPSAGSNPANFSDDPQTARSFLLDESSSDTEQWPNPANLQPIDNPSPKISRRVIDTDWVPVGFEELDEPQETEVDLFYGGFYLVSVRSRFTDVDILILDPDKLIDTLVDLKDPGSFRELLEAPLYTNANKLCKNRSSINCGVLTTDSVGVIFDQSSLRMDLFIAPDLLKTRTPQQLAFLPPSDAGFSLLDYASIYTSGSAIGENHYNLANTTILSYAENRVLMRSNFTDSANFSVDTLAVAREFQGKDFQAGIFRGNAGSFLFMKDTLFVGATVESSLITRNDLSVSLGNEIEVFLDSRSRVEVYKDGRLINTQFYDVGNQLINTSSFPAGAYDIEIKIINSAGIERLETQFFSKSSRLPPADQSLYFLQLGEEMDQSNSDQILPKGNDTRFLRAGISHRLTDSLGTGFGFSTNQTSTMIEASGFKQGNHYELQSVFAYDDLQVSALDLKLRMRFENMHISFSSRRIWNDLPDTEVVSQIGGEALQNRLSGTWNTGYGSFNAFYRENKTSDTNTTRNYGARWDKNWTSGIGSLNGSLEFSTNDGQDQVLFRLNYRFQKNRWVHVAAVRYQDRGQQGNVNNDGVSGYVSSDWQNASAAANRYQVGFRTDSEDGGTFETRASAKGNLGNAALTSAYRHDLGYANYSGSANTSFVVTKQAFGIGGDRQALSGFLVSTKGKSDEGGDVSVIVDGSKRAKVKLNSTRFVPASEYDIHDISFLTEGKTLLNVDTKTYRKTLYPGNVIAIEVEAKHIIVVLGQLLKPDGTPLSHALLLGTQGIAISDDQGYFQAEIDADMASITVKKAGQECVINLDSPSTNDQVIHLGTRTCQ